jgi:hypothetical protein
MGWSRSLEIMVLREPQSPSNKNSALLACRLVTMQFVICLAVIFLSRIEMSLKVAANLVLSIALIAHQQATPAHLSRISPLQSSMSLSGR